MRFFSRPYRRMRLVALLLVLAGLALVAVTGVQAYWAYQQMREVRERGFDAAEPDISQIDDWMPIRFVASAYGVPQAYLFAELDMAMTKQNSHRPLRKLGELKGYPPPEPGEESAIVSEVRAAVLAYRANPVATGLPDDKVHGWMSLRYVANAKGIGVAELVKALGLPAEANVNLPLDRLHARLEMRGGLHRFLRRVERAAASLGETKRVEGNTQREAEAQRGEGLPPGPDVSEPGAGEQHK